ncbi:Glutamyl-tRNA(Gln) amidotransferase subunit A [Hartmannibacter diazotrophicus]|uniref:Glutamyl-tRNA(Gln) amidotransferase subunit A n=1 Tax=Hartmannibacter diazotrophicus TaxID=1482074 RepID=A0A2C9D064_9HYPH|nr:amidase [Hartmannibacter diazotrophicus]SON53777.1 Glutamyl-tRNA(Gln) amidotransferase subunit A [Hartmannibacter diazotrophicus]
MTDFSAEAITAMTLAETVHLVQSGDLDPTAIADAFAGTIAAKEPEVQAFAHFDADRARAEAAGIDRNGPLAGVTLGVKDVIDTADMPTGYGSAAYEGYQPAWDAPIVAIARRLGGIVMGKTVSTEFAMASPNKTRNPHNTAHTPGGSSSGSCAAVAAGMVKVAFGTQTSGSIIRPASYCGVVGYKPSFGTLNRTAVKALSDSLDTIGVITPTVQDAALATAALSENPALAGLDFPRAPRLGLFRTSRWGQAEAATREALDNAAEAARAAGATVVAIDVPEDFEAFYAMHDAVMGWETPRCLAFERNQRADVISPITRTFLDTLARTTRADYEAALGALKDRAALLDRLIGSCDGLLTPAAPGEAPHGLGMTGDPVFNKVWTLLHGPCVTVPAGSGPNGLPVGVQLIGRLGEDAALLGLASFVEAALAAESEIA